jgi:hypothetical protein
VSNNHTLFIENNVISLRSAFIISIDSFVLFSLSPADLAAKMPKDRKWLRPQDFDWMSEDRVLLYRQAMPANEEATPKPKFPSLEPVVRPISFEKPPVFQMLWVDSGQSVALNLNGVLWAFIDESSHCGFSKGLIKGGRYMRPWDQQLFERIFLGS